VRAFYYDKQAQVYKQVEGPTLVDTAKGGFQVNEFDPTRDDPPFETFKGLHAESESAGRHFSIEECPRPWGHLLRPCLPGARAPP